MSTSSMVLRNTLSAFKEELRFKLKEHSHEIIVGAIMTVISVGIAIAATGDWNQAFAGRNRR